MGSLKFITVFYNQAEAESSSIYSLSTVNKIMKLIDLLGNRKLKHNRIHPE